MTKSEFLAEIDEKLSEKGLSQGDIEKSLDYYRELIEDSIEDGMTEEEAVASMGNPDDIASQILIDTPLPKFVKAKINERTRANRGIRTWVIVLLVLGSPVWVPLLIALLSVLLSIYIVLWSLIITLYSIVLSFAAASVFAIASGIILIIAGRAPHGLVSMGSGLLLAGLAIFMFLISNKAAVGIIKLGGLIARSIKSCFTRKGDVK